MEFNVESLQRQIPYYLTAEDRQVLVKELHSISSGHSPDYILSAYNDHFRKSMLQGDGWKGFQIFWLNLQFVSLLPDWFSICIGHGGQADGPGAFLRDWFSNIDEADGCAHRH